MPVFWELKNLKILSNFLFSLATISTFCPEFPCSASKNLVKTKNSNLFAACPCWKKIQKSCLLLIILNLWLLQQPKLGLLCHDVKLKTFRFFLKQFTCCTLLHFLTLTRWNSAENAVIFWRYFNVGSFSKTFQLERFKKLAEREGERGTRAHTCYNENLLFTKALPDNAHF